MSFVALGNPRTAEYGVLRRPAGGVTVADLYARPGAGCRTSTSTPR